jgi:hypothetical protein
VREQLILSGLASKLLSELSLGLRPLLLHPPEVRQDPSLQREAHRGIDGDVSDDAAQAEARPPSPRVPEPREGGEDDERNGIANGASPAVRSHLALERYRCLDCTATTVTVDVLAVC